MLRLDPEARIQEKYREIRPQDLAVSKEVTEENRFGQGSSKLAWFWTLDTQLNMEDGGLMEEFYRINWLKASTRRNRWMEDMSLVKHEMMFWTILWFKNQRNTWEARALNSEEPGQMAYAKKQVGLWSEFVQKAKLMFQGMQMDCT
ncbi:hypothetical protein M404DRAFT_157600 [Pisolithus tinctorius Marx 270]|uniref:Uncharacterized protein n=1 Tax=Pisolithus tinctorius Marx 270 TaxID=870435 RepID=A0A0C3NBF1_PISTI|nr:hypothetical protein M404DRAFT_157600 [Pisolithus tinctorius Marx 270]